MAILFKGASQNVPPICSFSVLFIYIYIYLYIYIYISVAKPKGRFAEKEKVSQEEAIAKER